MAAFHALAYSPDDTTAARADDSAANNTVDAATSNSDGNSNSCSNSSSGLPRVAFYTRVLGVQEEYGDFDFYKEEIATDTLRVGALFRRAAEAAAELEVEAGEGGRGGAAPPAAPRVVQATLDISTLCQVLRSRAVVAVALIDLNFLVPSRQHYPAGMGAKLLSGASAMAAKLPLPASFKRKAYRGHYVVLLGYLAATDEVVYRDPAGPPGHLGYVAACQLDKARGASGTDEDLLLVSVPAPSASSRGTC